MSGLEWKNWSGSIRLRPADVEMPRDDEQAVEVVRRAMDEGRTLRPLGSGHSSSRLLPTDDRLVSMENLAGVESVDRDRGEAWVRGGTKLRDVGEVLSRHHLAMPNLGDTDQQTIAGATSTGTHGTGKA